MNKETLGELAKQVTGINNELLAWLTLEFCNSIYPLEAYNVATRVLNRHMGYRRRMQYHGPDPKFLEAEFQGDEWYNALYNDKDPARTEIEQFCAPIRDLVSKFAKFEQLVRGGILSCEVSGNKNGAYLIRFTMQTEEPNIKNELFMKKFNPEDFKEESK